MRRLSLTIIFAVISINLFAQSPHGKNFNMDCGNCHNPESWKVIKKDIKFEHDKTSFPLAGQHKSVDCKMCHETLAFTGTKQQCFSCHKDIHKNSVTQDCAKCHTPQTWLITNINEVHQLSRFPLLGVHASQDCSQCHFKYSELNFEVLGVTCYDCHQKDYLTALNPDHKASNFSKNCEDCHSLTSQVWSTTNFVHDFFPLTGGHKISNCFSCHNQGSFAGLSTNCYSCHQNDYASTSNPNHINAGFSTNCTQCHTITNWESATFDHSLTRFQLTGKHAATNCNQCHTTGYTNTPTDCYSCHQSNYNQTSNPNHIAAGFPSACADCHTTIGWTPATFDHDGKYFPIYSGEHNGKWNACADCHTTPNNYAAFSCTTCHEHNQQDMNDEHQGISGYAYQSSACFNCHPRGSKEGAFNHSTTTFPLQGSHTNVSCQSCHQSGYSNTSTECNSCHHSKYQATVNPNHTSTGISLVCENCHTDAAWSPSTFNHSATSFALAGKHTTTTCESCHKGQTTGTSHLCYSCHKSSFDGAQDPNHIASGFPTTCEQCHNTNAWEPATFNHSSTQFPLTGKHTTVTCNQCHTTGYTNTPTDCYSCHQSNYNQTSNPNHAGAQFPTTCVDCHTTNGWTPATFDHDGKYFPIYSGEHRGEWNTCADCHTVPNNYSTFSCTTCHEHNQQDMNDEHQGISGYAYQSSACFNCHPRGSKEGSFNHSTTTFPLQGSHTSVSCQSCHQAGYSNTSTECNSCHHSKYQATISPNHTSTGISLVCENCHTAVAWSPSIFNHSTTTFVLAGKHTTTTCESCHKGQTTGTSQQCVSCHQNVFDTSLNPNHKTVGISTECQNCHTSQAWIPSSFNHSNTAFALTGSHLTANCESCHQGQTSGTSHICYNCHKSNFDSAQEPNHVTANFPTTCEQCHTTNAWEPATFDHSLTRFQLTGKHAATNCNQCHTTGYTNTPTDCYSCHQSNYNQTTNPNHIAAGFPTTCEQCHTTNAWEPATFDHSLTRFQLTGKHAATNCNQCHTTGYTNTPTDCYSCHQSNYNQTTNPNHIAAGFPTTCADCHTTNGWTPATFDHDGKYFPIYSGEHNGKWNACADCHTTPNNFADFSCTTCHEHNQQDMNNEHQGISGYAYQSSACFNCHPRGSKEGAFNHSVTAFPLKGSHTNVSCQGCHQTGYSNTSTECNSCHHSKYQTTVNPNHTTVGISTVCENCHTDASWSPSTFNHSATSFALAGKHTTTTCESCHKGQTTDTSQLCVSCHQSAFDTSLNPNHKTVGISTECQNCHTSQAWIPSSFNHSNTAFALTGSHLTANCESCHQGQTTGTGQQCVSCHQNVFDTSLNPNHKTVGISTECQTCHTPQAWTPSSFNHSNTAFALTGSHLTANCESCHQGQTAGMSRICYSCHKSSYESVQDPNHVASNFPTTCEQCHNTNAWEPATFNHSSTQFPLTGKHTTVTCNQCHSSGYTNTPMDCYSCHQTDYTGTTNPNHAAAKFPTTCNDCHTTNGWTPASFDHDGRFFPIYSGEHNGKWNTCADCHTNASNYAVFSCINCHEHSNQSEVNNDHREVSNYVYQSSACYNCHPGGSED